MRATCLMFLLVACGGSAVGTSTMPVERGREQMSETPPAPEPVSEMAPSETPVLALDQACWNQGTDACFVVNVTPEEDVWVSFRWGDLRSDPSTQFSFDDEDVETMLRETYASMKQVLQRDAAGTPQLAAQVTVLFDAATPPSRLRQAVNALNRAGLSPIATVMEGVLDPEARSRVEALSAVEMSVQSGGSPALEPTLREHELSLRACFLDIDSDQGPLLARFDIGDDGRIHHVNIRSALPEPTPRRPPCTEYDDHMGRCEREMLVSPTEMLDTDVVHCLKRALRALPLPETSAPQIYEDGMPPTTALHLRGPVPVHVVYEAHPDDRVN